MLGAESEERLLKVAARRLSIEAEEPPVLHVLSPLARALDRINDYLLREKP